MSSTNMISNPLLSPSTNPGVTKAAPFTRLAKRNVDIFSSLLLLILVTPLFFAVLVANVFGEKGALFFVHPRVGRNGKIFGCIKFRTMRKDSHLLLLELLSKDAEAKQEWEETRKLRNDPRVTSLGKLLRRTSLDELPQLLNVLRGDMSLVGPRPVVTEELEKYYHGSARDIYCSTRPGITGLWQVSGRSNTSYEYRVKLDCHYVQTMSLFNDVCLIGKTLKVVVKGDGAY